MFGRSKKIMHICGGTTDKTDHNAPKEIISKDITSFYASYSLTGEWIPGTDFVRCDFEVKPDENGVLMSYAPEFGIEYKADSDLMTNLQNIIDEQRLVLKNGLYRVTAGLPPEYQPCTLTIGYASGERLSFTENNDPNAFWAKQMYLAFAAFFARNGDRSMLPPEYKDQVTRLCIEIKENGISTHFLKMKVNDKDAINGEHELFHKTVWDMTEQKSICKEFIVFPDDFYDKLTTIVNSYDLRAFDRCSVLYGTDRTLVDAGKFDKDLADLRLHIEYQNGHRLYIDTSDTKDIEMLKPLISDIFKYFDSLFCNKK